MKSGAYESDITRFIRELREKNPQIADQQRKNRATWWDKRQDLELRQRNDESRVPQTGYQYYDKPGLEVVSGDPVPRDK